MGKYTSEQKKIAVLLMHSPKTVEELNNQLNIPYNDLTEQLKGMLKLDVISKSGYPPKYRLKENIVEAVRKRVDIAEKDQFKLRMKVIIEGLAIEEELLKKQMNDVKKALEKEKDFTIYDIRMEKIAKVGEHYSTFLEVNLSVKDFKALVKLMYFFGPSSVEILKPDKLEIPLSDLQDGLVDMAEMIQAYNHYILKMMNRQELAEFHRKLYEYK